MNKLMRNFLFVLTVLGAVFMVVLPFVGIAGAQDSKHHDFKWAMSARAVLEQFRRDKIVLIDVRSPDSFDQLRIPGSMNIPLYAVKTKSFLKDRHAVLIDEGYFYGRLEAECRKLKDAGFHVSILFGGLNAWIETGGELDGHSFGANRINTVSPCVFHLEKDYENNVIIDISGKRNLDATPLPTNAVYFSVVDTNGLKLSGFYESLNGAKQSNNKYQVIVIASKDGSGYEKAKKIIREMKINNVFYLDGGFHAYSQYLNDLSLSGRPKESRLKQQNKCNGCGT
jgi:rhodanese-related sulfurtransferase